MPLPRRDFIFSTAALGAAAMAPAALARGARAREAQTLGIGLIGCGGRGTGAAADALSASPQAQLVAMADLVPDRLEGSLGNLRGEEEIAERIVVGDNARYVGFDAYKQLLERNDIDVVILATPPGFRPIHFEAAVDAGKHVFMEKPVAVDPTGVRKVMAAAEKAKRTNRCVVAGTQRRHERSYLEAMKRVHDGAIGEIVSARCYWNQGGLWVHQRRPEYSDMEWQCRNWLYFPWLSGDHICEQHIHNLDVVNWAMGGPPVRAMGVGGRQARTGPEYGSIYDHFAIQFDYANGASCTSMCRQIDGCPPRVEEVIVGTEGTLTTRPGYAKITGRTPWEFKGENPNPYQQEHADLAAAIASGTPVNEGQRVAESTLTAVMGRLAAYTGQVITFDEALASQLDLAPPAYVFGPLPTPAVAIPGKTKMV
ncbi:MAG: Gfo/Idh/MocA family oxidoreductase [Phycisphaerales bacterium]|nr:Gfo/Idh/MocA family oxidoreductase [Phycisphaerales bacterium]